MKPLISYCQLSVTSFLSGPNTFLNTLNVRDQPSHPYKLTGKGVNLCTLIFGRCDKKFWTELTIKL